MARSYNSSTPNDGQRRMMPNDTVNALNPFDAPQQSTDRVLRRPTSRLRDAAVLSFITLCVAPAMFCIGWLVFGDYLHKISPMQAAGLPESIRDDIIWADRVETVRTYLPTVIAVSLVVAPIVFLIKLARPAPSSYLGKPTSLRGRAWSEEME